MFITHRQPPTHRVVYQPVPTRFSGSPAKEGFLPPSKLTKKKSSFFKKSSIATGQPAKSSTAGSSSKQTTSTLSQLSSAASRTLMPQRQIKKEVSKVIQNLTKQEGILPSQLDLLKEDPFRLNMYDTQLYKAFEKRVSVN